MSDAPKLRLPLPLREADPAIVAAGWYRLRARTKPTVTRRWIPAVAFAVVVAIALLVVRDRGRKNGLEPRGESLVVAGATPTRRDFKDGSWLELAPGARAAWSVPVSRSSSPMSYRASAMLLRPSHPTKGTPRSRSNRSRPQRPPGRPRLRWAPPRAGERSHRKVDRGRQWPISATTV